MRLLTLALAATFAFGISAPVSATDVTKEEEANTTSIWMPTST